MTNLSAKEIAARMGGRVERDSALVPGPGHSPADRSLSVKPDHDAPDGFIVHSFAGDDFAECRDHVRNKLGIVGDSRPISVPQGQRGRVVATYQYHNEAGDLLYEVPRYSPKDFKQRRPDGHGGWIWKLGDTQRVPYRLHELIAAVAAGRPIVIVEGEKDVDALRSAKIGIDATTFPAGAGKWRKEYAQHFAGADVVIIPDNDAPGRSHARDIAGGLSSVAKRVRILDLAACWPACPEKGDISDWIAAGGTRHQLDQWIAAAPGFGREETKALRLKPLSLEEFFSLTIKPRKMILDPIIPEKGLAMLYASRGTGKTHLALGIAYGAATGTDFLRWKAPRARRTLLIDGEMPAAALQERLATIVQGSNVEPDEGMLKVLAGDLIEDGGVGNLADPAVQAELDPHLDGMELLILDNLSSLTAVIRDNDAEFLESHPGLAIAAPPPGDLSSNRSPRRQGRRPTRHVTPRGRARHVHQSATPERLRADRGGSVRGPLGKGAWRSRGCSQAL